MLRFTDLPVGIASLKILEIQTLPQRHTIHFVDFQRIRLQVDFLFLHNLGVQQIPERSPRLYQHVVQLGDRFAQRGQLLLQTVVNVILAQFDPGPVRSVCHPHLCQRNVTLLFGNLLLQLGHRTGQFVNLVHGFLMDVLQLDFGIANLGDSFAEGRIGTVHLVTDVLGGLLEHLVDVRSQRLGRVDFLGGIFNVCVGDLDPLRIGIVAEKRNTMGVM